MKHWIVFLILTGLLVTCTEHHLIKNKTCREQVQQALQKQKQLLLGKNEQLFLALKKEMSIKEKEALRFLYAYMPLNDLLDYDEKFFYDQVKIALKARDEMPWGRSIPDDLFFHFVLPSRVSNENLDTFRLAVYDELKQRVEEMNMRKAALEINHWCHEKVTYRPTDARTSSPLSLMRTSWGRCGEEAVFTVNAMRTVGIPARQVYTPRWAHTDDNHAWVEVWINGKWYFLGACEPEPELNMGWFAEPVTRAMMVNSAIYGYYDGNETVSSHRGKTAVLNITGNYTPVKQIFIKVSDRESKPVNSAKVFFKLFNYGELTSIASKETDSTGVVSITTGLGDLVVWATDQINFGYKKITIEQVDTVNIVINKTPDNVNTDQFDLVPPINHTPRKVDAHHREENKRRLSEEDKIRKSYMSTFPDSTASDGYASRFDVEPGRLWKIIRESAGNWKEIIHFIEQGSAISKEETLRVLEVISDKDLRDTKASVLFDHLKNANNVKENWKKSHYEDYIHYILNPRIANENLVPYRSFIQQSFTDNQKTLFQADPSSLFFWIKEKVTLIEEEDFSRVVISPVGVMKSKMADLYSLNVFFVATCRSLGIPARINRQSFALEYFVRGEWRSVRFKEAKDTVILKGFLHLTTSEKEFDPLYYKHWSIARYENGIYQTIGLAWNTGMSTLPDKIELNTGDYVLSTGIRKNNGTVLCKLSFFQIKENETTHFNAGFRKSEEKLNVLGEINLDNTIHILETDQDMRVSKLLDKQEAIFIWIDPDKEPTKHVMGNLVRLKDQFEKWNGKIILLPEEESIAQTLDISQFPGIPSNCIYVCDKKMKLRKSIERKNHKLALPQYPIILVVDQNGKYYYYSNGYKIGVGEQLIKTLRKLSGELQL